MREAEAPSTTPVSALMHRGIIDCPPQTRLGELAAAMAEGGVHCVVIEGLAKRRGGEEMVWGIVSDMDLIRAAAAGELDDEVGDLAATEIVTIESQESMERAIQVMSEHEITHLVVIAPSGEPVGVLSGLDVARFIGSLSRDQVAPGAVHEEV